MAKHKSIPAHHTAESMAQANLENALRVLAMVPRGDAGGMVPHPVDIVRAEIANAMHYLSLSRGVPNLAQSNA